MRPEIIALVELGEFPTESEAVVSDLARREELLRLIVPPVSDDEAVALVKLLGPGEDSCFGLKWSIVHLVETAPSWPIHEALDDQFEWARFLAQRARAAERDR